MNVRSAICKSVAKLLEAASDLPDEIEDNSINVLVYVDILARISNATDSIQILKRRLGDEMS